MDKKKSNTQLWTIEEFAEWLRITPVAARAMIRRRELPQEGIFKVGRRVRLRSSVIQQWVLNQDSR